MAYGTARPVPQSPTWQIENNVESSPDHFLPGPAALVIPKCPTVVGGRISLINQFPLAERTKVLKGLNHP